MAGITAQMIAFHATIRHTMINSSLRGNVSQLFASKIILKTNLFLPYFVFSFLDRLNFTPNIPFFCSFLFWFVLSNIFWNWTHKYFEFLRQKQFYLFCLVYWFEMVPNWSTLDLFLRSFWFIVSKLIF